MAKIAFAYHYGDRVNVPGKKLTQGVVATPNTPSELVNAKCPDDCINWYFVRWTMGDGRQTFGWFSESDLRDANEGKAPVATYDPSVVIAAAKAAKPVRKAPTKKKKR